MSKLSQMNTLINTLSDQPFKYGKNDCYTFTAKLVKAWHGKDYIKLHACYKTEKEARKYMDEYGGIEALTVGTLGYARAPETCEDGDVVSAEVARGDIALGFVFNKQGFFKAKKTVLQLPLSECRMGWKLNG